jgi:hypothetical protein
VGGQTPYRYPGQNRYNPWHVPGYLYIKQCPCTIQGLRREFDAENIY